MKRLVIGYSAALVVALSGAYRTWVHEGDPDLSGSTVILDAEADNLASVVFEGPVGTLQLEMREDGFGSFVWGTFTPGGGDEPVAPESFKVGTPGVAAFESLAPFVARRVLEGVDESKLEELGFGAEQASLTIVRQGKPPKAYEIGAKVYGGSKRRYVRDPDDGTIYIVAASVIQPLETRPRTLRDGSLFAADVTDIDAVTVRGGEAEATFVQNNPDDRSARFWALEGSAEPNPAAAGWFDKALNKLRVAEYLSEGERPSGLEEVFSFVVASGRTTTEVIVFRLYDDDGEAIWYATSPHNRGLVRLDASSAAETHADLASVLDAGA